MCQRNRLIAAAAQAVVVVEAGVRSGSLNTAAHAASLGRPLGAVPGPVTSPASAGCHRLLREYDAVCVTTADEVAELVVDPVRADTPVLLELEGASSAAEVCATGARATEARRTEGRAAEARRRSPEQVRVLDATSRRSARPVEDIARRAGLSVQAAQAALGALGLEGVVEEREGGWRSMPAP